jgi:hypothetical protein
VSFPIPKINVGSTELMKPRVGIICCNCWPSAVFKITFAPTPKVFLSLPLNLTLTKLLFKT